MLRVYVICTIYCCTVSFNIIVVTTTAGFARTQRTRHSASGATKYVLTHLQLTVIDRFGAAFHSAATTRVSKDLRAGAPMSLSSVSLRARVSCCHKTCAGRLN